MPTMSSCSLMSSTWSLIPITHQCNVSQKSLPHIALSGLFSLGQLQCAVQCNEVCKVVGGAASVRCGVDISFPPQNGDSGENTSTDGERTALRQTARSRCNTANYNTARLNTARTRCTAPLSIFTTAKYFFRHTPSFR